DRAGEAGGADVELLGEPQGEQQQGGHGDDRGEEDNQHERDHAGARIQQQVAAEDRGDAAGGAERGNLGGGVDEHLDGQRDEAAEQVEAEEAQASERVLHGGAEPAQEQEVAEQVQEAAVQQQRGEDGGGGRRLGLEPG